MNAYFEGNTKLAQTHVITLGNPLIAKNFMQYDQRAGLYIPPRVLVQETSEGGTLVMFDLPSSVMSIDPNPPEEMKEALLELDTKLEKMLTRILSS